MIPGKRYTPRSLLATAARYKWALIVPVLLVSSAAMAIAYYLPDRFRSETLILVVPQRIPEEYVRPTVTAKIEDRLQLIQQQIKSRSRLERIIDEFDLYKRQRQTQVMEVVVDRMRDAIDLQLVRVDAFRVSYEANDPIVARDVTARLAALFIEESLKDREVLASDTRAFLEGQLEDARRRLLDHERRLAEFQRQHAGELPSQREAILQAIQTRQLQVQSLLDSLARDRDRRIGAERQRADLANEIAFETPVGGPSAAADQLENAPAAVQLEAAQAQLRRLETRLTADHPDVVRLKRSIEVLTAKAEAEAKQERTSPARLLTPAEIARRNRLKELDAEILNLDRQIAYKEREEGRIRAEIVSYQAKAEAIPTRESELIALTRDYDTLKQTYQSLLVKKEDSKLAEDLERRKVGEQFKVLDAATLPQRPHGPNRVLIRLGGVALALALGIGLVVLLEIQDQKIRDEADVQLAVSLPVLAAVPVMPSTAGRAQGWRFRTTASVVTAVLIIAGIALVAFLRG